MFYLHSNQKSTNTIFQFKMYNILQTKYNQDRKLIKRTKPVTYIKTRQLKSLMEYN